MKKIQVKKGEEKILAELVENERASFKVFKKVPDTLRHYKENLDNLERKLSYDHCMR